MLTLDQPRKAIRRIAARIVRFIDKASNGKVTPDQITWIGVIAHLPVAFLIAYGRFELAALLMIVFGLFDVLDGELARYKKIASPRGMVLDASTDRIKETMIYSGIAYYLSQTAYFSWAWVPMLALGGILTVTYIKAKGEVAYAINHQSTDHHKVNRHFNEGLVSFEGRTLIIIIGLITGQILLAAGLIAGLGIISTFERLQAITKEV